VEAGFLAAISVFRLSLLQKLKEELRMDLMKRLLQEEDGQGVIEYILIVAMISIVAIALIGAVGGKVNNMYKTVNDQISL